MVMAQEKYLTDEQKVSFERDGFLVIRGMYSPAEISEISLWIDELLSGPRQVGKEMLYLEDSLKNPGTKIPCRIEYFVDFHQDFKQFVYSERMIGCVSELLGGPAVLFKEKVNFKMPGGEGFKPHQDIQPGWDDYADYFISVLVTIDTSTTENGCLELAAGHHKRGWLGERWKPLEGEQLNGIEFVKYPMEPGDIAFFDCYTPHQSAANLTDKQRRNLYLTYNRKSDGDFRERYFREKRQNFPPDNERDPGQVYRFKV